MNVWMVVAAGSFILTPILIGVIGWKLSGGNKITPKILAIREQHIKEYEKQKKSEAKSKKKAKTEQSLADEMRDLYQCHLDQEMALNLEYLSAMHRLNEAEESFKKKPPTKESAVKKSSLTRTPPDCE